MPMMADTEAIFHINSGIRSPCTVVIGQTALFLGGSDQISQLTPLGVMRIGTLPFSLNAGTCLIMGRQLFLGFGDWSHTIGTSSHYSCWSR